MTKTQNNTEKEAKNLNLRSEQVQEILGRPPRWMIRWGITLIFIILGIVLAGSWFFQYPDVITANVMVTTENPPAPIVAKSTGKIDHLFVTDQKQVKEDEPLAVIENTAFYRDILSLDEMLQGFKDRLGEGNVKLIEYNKDLKLGDVQSYYASFIKKLEDYNHFHRLDYHRRKIEMLREEEERYRQHFHKLLRQKQISKKEFDLAKRQYQRDSILFNRDVIPEAELEKSETFLLQKRYALEQTEISLSNARIQLSQIEQNILEMELQYENRKNQLEISLIEAYANLVAAIETWKRRFYLVSPMAGKVTFTSYWSENQYVEAGKRVMTVIPSEKGEIIGKITMSFQGAGKVRTGQQVNISFKNYPPMEFGMVKGVVRSISLVPEDNVYTVEVSLPNGLTTFYDEKLEFSQEMRGTAEIITEDTRLLERIIRPLRFMVNKNLKD